MPFAYCQFTDYTVMCGPRGLPGEPDHLFHNNGDGTFTDVSAKAGRRRQGTRTTDSPRSLWMSTATASRTCWWQTTRIRTISTSTKATERLRIDSYVSGFALNKDGREIASMGIAVGDYMNNGLIDLLVTDFSRRLQGAFPQRWRRELYRRSHEAGIAQITIPFVGWGDGFLDYDNDGWIDSVDQWPCLSRSGPARLGDHLCRTAAAVSGI